VKLVALGVAVVALSAPTTVLAQDADSRARDDARAELSRLKERNASEEAAVAGRVAALRRELLDVSSRASEAEIDAAMLAVRLDEATHAREAGATELAEVDAELADVVAALGDRRGPGDAAAPDLPTVVAGLEKRLAAAGVIAAAENLLRIGDLQWIEVLDGDRAIVGGPGRAAPVGPIDAPGVAAVLEAVRHGDPPPFILIDPTGRLELTAPSADRNLAGWLDAGGPIAVVICALGVLGLLLAMARLGWLFAEPSPAPEDVARARVAVVAGDREAAARILRGRRGAVHEALARVALVDEGGGEATREARIEQVLLWTVDRFERFLHLVAVLAAVLPLLGLLGTVVGMIRMFDALSGGRSAANHVEALSGGIGEALITTEAGLFFAIPLMLLHAVISARADKLEAALEDAALEVAGGEAP
jgi:biopolymer transport protein ExbB/TolQ